ncbi:MAG: serine/threonine protein kinase, partial [Acidimicrobiales bacterium]|nr:serine/threonine protein kinase [Acidimicrobiales bacterium]
MANPRMTAEIGRVLGGRYRLVAPIGMGASAQVYLADDVKLRRRVALKMLHDALAGDAEFLRRFRAEAQAAAALSHPNVMAVYDWSDATTHGEAAFIVTEYLPGGSLRALLDGGALLAPSQALGVGLEAARALDYAHRRGFVHRDVKPANLLFGEDQRLRIADFGLARALAEAAWTEPQGAVLGTARYASPEQAKGESLTGKADVYALALVIIESVTGEVPFVADTTLGTLMARVDRPLVVPDELGPLQAVLTEAGRPDPDERIDARTLAKGLLRAAQELPRPAPLPLAGAIEAGAAGLVDQDPTSLGPTAAASAALGAAAGVAASDLTAEDLDLDPPDWVNQSDLDASPPGPPAPVEPIEEQPGPAVEAEEPGPDATVVEPVPAPPVAPDDAEATGEVEATPVDEDEGGGRRRRWPWVAAIVVLVGLIAGGVAYAATRSEPADAGPLLELP